MQWESNGLFVRRICGSKSSTFIVIIYSIYWIVLYAQGFQISIHQNVTWLSILFTCSFMVIIHIDMTLNCRLTNYYYYYYFQLANNIFIIWWELLMQCPLPPSMDMQSEFIVFQFSNASAHATKCVILFKLDMHISRKTIYGSPEYWIRMWNHYLSNFIWANVVRLWVRIVNAYFKCFMHIYSICAQRYRIRFRIKFKGEIYDVRCTTCVDRKHAKMYSVIFRLRKRLIRLIVDPNSNEWWSIYLSNCTSI